MPSNLQGLNLVQPPQPEVDSQDLLHYPPDVAAQLALWTNLHFENEEGSILPLDDKFGKSSPSVDDEEDETRAVRDSTVNNLPTNPEQSHAQQRPMQQPHSQNALDINSLLNGYALGGFPQPQQQHDLQALSLAQILALHPLAQNGSLYQQQPMQQFPMIQPQQSQRIPQTETRSPTSSSGGIDIAPPPAKRARTRKPSVSTTAESPTDYTESSPSSVSPAEDKRRRNTAASARFRLKKKEREFALETKAKELETRVNELERECEGLRRENGWLKGLVVGVTGAAQNNSATQSPKLAGTRRSRDDDSA